MKIACPSTNLLHDGPLMLMVRKLLNQVQAFCPSLLRTLCIMEVDSVTLSDKNIYGGHHTRMALW